MENRYCLQMVSCGDGCCGNGGSTGAENVYSTEETVCGKWIDGKPIYRKVITGNLAEQNGSAHVFTNASELEIEKVINLYGNLIDKDDYQLMIQTSYNEPRGLYAAVNMYYSTQNGNMYYHLFNNSGSISGRTAYVVIEYTKK